MQSLILIKIIAYSAIALFYSILIFVSSHIMNIWIQKIYTKFIKIFDLILFYKKLDVSSTTNSMLKQYIINSKNIIIKTLKLNFFNSKIVKIIILSAYIIWLKHMYKLLTSFLDSVLKKLIKNDNQKDKFKKDYYYYYYKSYNWSVLWLCSMWVSLCSSVRWKQHVLSRWADQKETLNMSQSSSWSNALRINNTACSDFDNKTAKKLSLEAQSHS